MMQAGQGAQSPPQKRENPADNRVNSKNPHLGAADTRNNSKTTGEMLDSLRAAMLAQIGHAPDTISTTGKLERFDTIKKGDKAGWYVCHLTRWGLVAVFGDWREGYPHKWSSFEPSLLPKSDLAELRKIQHQQDAERRAERDRLAESARDKAASIWHKATPASHAHPYLLTKQVQAHGIRQAGDRLIIPITDLDGYLHNVQTITPDGTKRFLAGGRKRGLCCLIGDSLTHPQGVFVCEGWATGASLYELYGLPVLVAFDAGNLLPVAQAYRARYIGAPITICADDDRKTPGNPGMTKATEAAAKVPGVSVAIPQFPAGAPQHLSDINDLLVYTRSQSRMEATP